jgi:hypothetical protein
MFYTIKKFLFKTLKFIWTFCRLIYKILKAIGELIYFSIISIRSFFTSIRRIFDYICSYIRRCIRCFFEDLHRFFILIFKFLTIIFKVIKFILWAVWGCITFIVKKKKKRKKSDFY